MLAGRPVVVWLLVEAGLALALVVVFLLILERHGRHPQENCSGGADRRDRQAHPATDGPFDERCFLIAGVPLALFYRKPLADAWRRAERY